VRLKIRFTLNGGVATMTCLKSGALAEFPPGLFCLQKKTLRIYPQLKGVGEYFILEVTMNANERNELAAKLRQMIIMNEKAEDKRNHRKTFSGKGNIIRRRKGEQDKRISA
jgi:hypothetical protein